MEEISELEWLILDSLSDDIECVATIWPYVKSEMPSITSSELKNTIYSLYQRGFICAAKEKALIAREDILAEETENDNSTGNYYFGLTSKGVEAWEEVSIKYDEPVDWSNSWSASYDFQRSEGCIVGTSREVCLNELKVWKENQWQVDMSSLVDSEIEGFQAKYYKYIPGGHQVSFKLKRCEI